MISTLSAVTKSSVQQLTAASTTRVVPSALRGLRSASWSPIPACAAASRSNLLSSPSTTLPPYLRPVEARPKSIDKSMVLKPLAANELNPSNHPGIEKVQTLLKEKFSNDPAKAELMQFVQHKATLYCNNYGSPRIETGKHPEIEALSFTEQRNLAKAITTGNSSYLCKNLNKLNSLREVLDFLAKGFERGSLTYLQKECESMKKDLRFGKF